MPPVSKPQTVPSAVFDDTAQTAVPIQPEPKKVRPTFRRRIGRPAGAPQPPPVPPPKGPPGSQFDPLKRARKKHISWGKDQTKEYSGPRHTEGRILPWVPSERERHQGYRQLGQHQGREMARREHQLVLDKMRKQNRNLVAAIRQRGGEQLDARERIIRDQTQAGGRLVQQGHELARRANIMEAEKKKQIRQLQEGMGRQGLRAQRAEQRVGQLLQEGRGLEAEHKARMKRGGEQIAARDKAYGALKAEANRRIQSLEKKISDGSADRASAQKEIDRLTQQLAAAAAKPAAKQDPDGLSGLRADIAGLKDAMKSMPRRERRQAAQAPIVVQGGSGGGGASSSAGGSSASSGGGGAAQRAAAPDLSKVVEAVKQIADAASKKKGAAKSTKGISQARRTYTDKRKTKIAELRALKSKRIREFAAKTKKLPKAERTKQRRDFKKKVEAQFKELQTRFPTARGLKSVGVIRELIRKIDAFKSAK